jgi:hypothetical protein
VLLVCLPTGHTGSSSALYRKPFSATESAGQDERPGHDKSSADPLMPRQPLVRKTPASTMATMTLSLSVGATREASPSCSARK